jgi:hypothetical protein
VIEQGGFICHYCNGSNGSVARIYQGENGWPQSLQYLCPDCLFSAVENGELDVNYNGHKFTGFDAVNDSGAWQCYHCEEGRDRVALIPGQMPYNLEYLCPDCLMDVVVEGTFVVRPVGMAKTKVVEEAAPIGPTAEFNKESGVVSIDDVEFRW